MSLPSFHPIGNNTWKNWCFSTGADVGRRHVPSWKAVPWGLLAGIVWITSVGCTPGQSNSPPAEGASGPARSLPSDDALRAMVDDTLAFTHDDRVLDLDTNAAWQILHGVLAYGRDFEVQRGEDQVNVLDWVFGGGTMKGWTLAPGPVGLRAIEEPGTKAGQGHPDQWVAVISQCGVPLTQKIHHAGKDYTLDDMLAQAMYETYDGKECSWTLIALSRYMEPFEKSWDARDGTQWTLERMIAMEAGPEETASGRDYVYNAACGGTHRLIGMQMALDRYQEHFPDQEFSGGWARAVRRIEDAVVAAKANQLPSGAFSIDYFQRPSPSSDLSEHLGATGHTLEFLTFALSEEELAEPWVTRAVVYLCDLFRKTRKIDLECGALYHAAHGLALYRERRFGKPEATR